MSSVKTYTSPTCPHCQRTKQFLRENNVDFEDFDVTSDAEKREEMQQKSKGLSVPVIDVDGKIIVGFDKDRLKEALALR